MITMPAEVKDIRLLRRMEKAGFIKLHHQTGQKITGLYDKQNYFICTYIDEGRPSFVFEGWLYKTEFVSGCFNPYVFCYGKAE